MKLYADEIFYSLLYLFDLFGRPSLMCPAPDFEQWAYQRGLGRRLWEWENKGLIERQQNKHRFAFSLKQTAETLALKQRNPTVFWEACWTGKWYFVLFDIPEKERSTRIAFQTSLKNSGFGYLQNSVWITPHSIEQYMDLKLLPKGLCDSLLILEGAPLKGWTDKELVSSAWNFGLIANKYQSYLSVMEQFAKPKKGADLIEHTLDLLSKERRLWAEATRLDPFLPKTLNPKNYSGFKAYQLHCEILNVASNRLWRKADISQE